MCVSAEAQWGGTGSEDDEPLFIRLSLSLFLWLSPLRLSLSIHMLRSRFVLREPGVPLHRMMHPPSTETFTTSHCGGVGCRNHQLAELEGLVLTEEKTERQWWFCQRSCLKAFLDRESTQWDPPCANGGCEKKVADSSTSICYDDTQRFFCSTACLDLYMHRGMRCLYANVIRERLLEVRKVHMNEVCPPSYRHQLLLAKAPHSDAVLLHAAQLDASLGQALEKVVTDTFPEQRREDAVGACRGEDVCAAGEALAVEE